MTTPHTFTLRRKVTFAVLALALVASTIVLFADRAAAHKATLSVSVSCQVDGRWTASWALSNSEAAKTMEIEEEDVTDLAPNPTPYSGTSRDSTTHANTVAQVTAHVRVDWAGHPGATVSATAHRPEACQFSSTTVPPTTSTTDPVVPSPPPVVERPRPAVPAVLTPDFTG